MLADPLSITYNAVAISMKKIKEANGASQYYAENGGRKFTLDFSHTIPPNGKGGESHLAKLTVEHFDANGIFLRSVSPWSVVKTFDQPQVAADAEYAARALRDLLTNAVITQLVGREV